MSYRVRLTENAAKETAIRTETRTTDNKARLVLPKSFANTTTVIVEQLSETELRVRRAAKETADDEFPFAEESPSPLSDRDRDRFLELLANPPAPASALEQAAVRRQSRRG